MLRKMFKPLAIAFIGVFLSTSIAERAKGWQELMDQYGKYTVYGFTKQGNFNYSFLVFSEREKVRRGVQLEFEPAAPAALAKR